VLNLWAGVVVIPYNPDPLRCRKDIVCGIVATRPSDDDLGAILVLRAKLSPILATLYSASVICEFRLELAEDQAGHLYVCNVSFSIDARAQFSLLSSQDP
jgi:hypothetical protein